MAHIVYLSLFNFIMCLQRNIILEVFNQDASEPSGKLIEIKMPLSQKFSFHRPEALEYALLIHSVVIFRWVGLLIIL